MSQRILVFGGGVPALACAMRLLRTGLAVDLLGPTEAARHPCLPQGGIVVGRDPQTLAETLAGGEAIAPADRGLAEATSSIVEQLARLGVPFARDGEQLALRRLPGWEEAEAAYVGARTASSIAWALDTELRRLVDAGADLRRFSEREIVDVVVDDRGAACGLVLFDRVSGVLEGLHGDAVVLATTGAAGSALGAAGRTFPELAVAAAYRAGAAIAGHGQPELHPTMLRHGLIPQPLSSALRAEGARFWVPKDAEEARIPRDIPPGDRDHFVEERFGKEALVDDRRLARLVRDVTETRGVYDRSLGDHRGTAYLDISHLPAGHLGPRLGGELDAIAARAPRHPHRGPFEIGAGVVGLGAALWVDSGAPERAQRTSLPGLWAVGACALAPHERARDRGPLDGMSLIAEIHGAQRAADAIAASRGQTPTPDHDAVEAARAAAEDAWQPAHAAAAPARDELVDALDDLGFDLVSSSTIRDRLVTVAEGLDGGRPARAHDRAALETIELVIAACFMKERFMKQRVQEEPSRWQRGEDGMPEEATV